jgi:SAM-dependent methyltransferase
MQTTYSEISQYWAENPCSGGNPDFPFGWWKGKKVLEIGCGTGVDSLKFVKAGAIYTGIDLVPRPPYIQKMNAEYIDFPSETFDLVYSFGVIHHTLNPEIVMNEIYHVLKPDGYLFIMLYNKFSWRYLVEIKILRRILWFLRYPKFDDIRDKLPHPTKQEWLSINTDEIGCPISRAYTKKDVEKLLYRFEITKTWTEQKGWFRLICAKKKSTT